MAKNQTLDEFYKQFREEVLCATDTETSGWTTDDFLTAVMLEYLEEAGEVTDPIICPFRDRGLQMNACAISEDCESVDLFVSIYSDTEMPRSVSQTDIEMAIKRGVQLYQRAQEILNEQAASLWLQDLCDLVVMNTKLDGMTFYATYVLDMSTIYYK